MALKVLYYFLKCSLLFMILALLGILIILVPYTYLLIMLKKYGLLLANIVLVPIVIYGIYYGWKEITSLTLVSLEKQLPFLKKESL